MDKILKEEIKKIINANEIFIRISKTLKDKNGYDYNEYKDIELKEYIKNKSEYEKDFLYISYVNKNNFNKIEDVRLEIEESLNEYFYELTDKEKFVDEEDGLNNYINALVEEHMKLYDTEEIQSYIKELLNI